MFGLGKSKQKKDTKKEGVKKASKDSKKEAVVTAVLPDEKFTVMPKQYLPEANSSSSSPGSSKKMLLLVGGSILILLILVAVLYILFFAGDKNSTEVAEVNNPPVTTQPKTPDTTTEDDDEEEVKDKIVSAESFDELNQLSGMLSMTIPSSVVKEYGQGMGITVLSEEDLGVSSDDIIMGGIYSLYPVAITFDKPVSLELSVANAPTGVEKEDMYPVFLRGTRWQEIEDYQVTTAGYAFSFEKFPTGPISAVRKIQDTTPEETDFDILEAIPSKDTDSDGLTDKEEQLLGTSISSVDSDEDTYVDKDEIFSGYSPSMGAGVTIEEDTSFSTYTNETYGYKVQYPTQWLADSLDQTNKQVLFISDTEEFFEILIEENPLNTPIVDWYRGQSPSLANIQLEIAILDSRAAVWSPDKMTLYASKDGLVYILTYNSGTLEEINWPTIFEYFYKKFEFGNTNNNEAGDDDGNTDPLNGV